MANAARSAVQRIVRFLAAPARVETGLTELRERVEYLEDSLAAFEARAERDDDALRPWSEVKR